MSRKALYYVIGGALFAYAAWKGVQMYSRAQFRSKFAEALKTANLRGFSPAVLEVEASYESGDGNGAMAKPGNNIFSLQAPASWKGPVQIQSSTGNKFRVYGSWTESINDFISLLIGWPSNYGTATAAAKRGDIVAFANALQNAPNPYDSKSTYAAELIARSKEFIV